MAMEAARMNPKSSFASRFRSFSAVMIACAVFGGCADEQDPKTWVKRLDDPVTRVQSIKRLGEFFNSAMEK